LVKNQCVTFEVWRLRLPAKGTRAHKELTMNLLELLLLLLIAGVCGALAQSITGYSHGGCLTSIALGFVGALLGTWLARLAKLPDLFTIQVGNASFPILWSIIGGALFAALLAFLTRPPARV
jgi:uncharacterized membrane protein YeaQ/YmgE (transglycosylase-associated protein family)